MDLIKGVTNSLTTNAFKDTAKLVIIGSTVEATRRVGTNVWNSFIDSFFLTAHFSQEDYPYDWIMHWLAKQPSYAASREFDVGSTRSTGVTGISQDIEDDAEDENSPPGVKRTVIQFLPSFDIQHSIFYRGHWLKITRTRRGSHGYAELKISVVARNNNILKHLVIQARREYEVDMEHRVHIFLAESTSWRWNGAQKKRPLSSVVLEPGVKDMLIADARDFLASEVWYAERGIPYRRGYLLHGVPGSGKTSLIHAIAGELSLDIYVVSLSAKGMSDNALTSLLGRVPARCILLLEDLDAAFTKSTSRDAKSTGAPATTTTTTTTATSPTVTTPEDPNTLSLSGLLNSLDGVAASVGRLLFATTNHYERLDPALTRPGRLDVHVDFKHASRWQAEGIFKNFYPTKPKPKKDEVALMDVSSDSAGGLSTASAPPPPPEKPKRKNPAAPIIPLLEEEELAELAKKFAAQIPEDEMSVAGLQGYLLRNKTRPREAVAEVTAWIEKEREAKAKLKKLKEEEAKKAEEEAAKGKSETEASTKTKEAKEEIPASEKKEDKKDKKEKAVKIRRPSTKKAVKPEPPKESSQSDSDSESEETSATTTSASTNASASNAAKVENPTPDLSSSESTATTAPTTSDELTSSESATSSGDELESCTTDACAEGAEAISETATKWVRVKSETAVADKTSTTAADPVAAAVA